MADYAGWMGNLGNLGPEVAQMGGTMLNMQTRQDEAKASRDAAREARVMVLEQRAADQAASLADRQAARAEAAALRREMQAAQQTFQAQLAQMQDQTRREMPAIAAAFRTPPQPVAPSVTQIVDPNDPSRMLSIDARTYQGGSVGSPGVIGIAGREPASQKRIEGAEAGRRQVTEIVNTLNDRYNELERLGGVISTERGAIPNLGTRLAASGPGQLLLGGMGTQTGSQREQIITARPLLMQAIRQATGMSAKAMDSNVELKFYMQAATDPTLGIEANRAAMALLDRTYGLGMGVNADPEKVRELQQRARGSQSPTRPIAPPGGSGGWSIQRVE
jgi:hypothetical protein